MRITKCQIVLHKRDNRLLSILCNYEGHPPYMLKILDEFYNDPVKVEQLLNLGNIMILRERLYPLEGREHSINDPQEGVTISYNRDSKFKNAYSVEHSSVEHLKNTMHVNDVEWGYMFREEDNMWYLITQF